MQQLTVRIEPVGDTVRPVDTGIIGTTQSSEDAVIEEDRRDVLGKGHRLRQICSRTRNGESGSREQQDGR